MKRSWRRPRGSQNRHDREAFENQAKGVMLAWASLVYKPVVAQGDTARAVHNDDYARMLDSVGLSEVAADMRTSGIRWAWEQALDVIDRVQSSGLKQIARKNHHVQRTDV
ncbi:hypothetical protein [Burkholderia sp. BCC1047]|uniref:hypothetical protein n=1 Tax=Burkholderia sp. BCC1047 TaxID=2676299 RepID=UPI00158BC3B5|nr:hypothetical protein [Burkholderia sp. BCC1047]